VVAPKARRRRVVLRTAAAPVTTTHRELRRAPAAKTGWNAPLARGKRAATFGPCAPPAETSREFAFEMHSPRPSTLRRAGDRPQHLRRRARASPPGRTPASASSSSHTARPRRAHGEPASRGGSSSRSGREGGEVLARGGLVTTESFPSKTTPARAQRGPITQPGAGRSTSQAPMSGASPVNGRFTGAPSAQVRGASRVRRWRS